MHSGQRFGKVVSSLKSVPDIPHPDRASDGAFVGVVPMAVGSLSSSYALARADGSLTLSWPLKSIGAYRDVR